MLNQYIFYCGKCESKFTFDVTKLLSLQLKGPKKASVLNVFLSCRFFFQTSMNVKSEHTIVTDTPYVPTQQEASNAAAAPDGSEMALSALVRWKITDVFP